MMKAKRGLVNVGVVGSGFMGRTYVDAVTRQSPNVAVVAVTGGSRAERLAADYGIAHEPSLEALVARADVELAILATPNSQHRDQSLVAAEAGKHVLVENPMALSVSDCSLMIDACRRAGVRLFAVKTTRFRQSPAVAKRLIDSGAIGTVRMVSVDMLMTSFKAPAMEDPSNWANDAAEGSAFLGWGGHNCDALRWFVGSEPTLAFGQFTNFAGPLPPGASGMAQFTFASGVLAQLWMSSELPPPGLPSLARFQIVGSEGIIDCDGLGKVLLGRGGEWRLVYEMPPIDWMNDPRDANRQQAFADEVSATADALRGAPVRGATGEDGRAAVAMALAAEEAASSGETVRFTSRT
jgi:predicted dehydrogenase